MIIIGLRLLLPFITTIWFTYTLHVKKVMAVYKNTRYPRIQRKDRVSIIGRYSLVSKITLDETN